MRPLSRERVPAGALVLLALSPWLLSAGSPPPSPQDEGGSAPQGEVAPDHGESDLQKEMVELIHRVELRLGAMDRMLSDAGAGVVPLTEVGESGIDDLLRRAEQKSRENVDDIDRILDIARQIGAQQQQSSGAGSGGQQSQQPGESPLDQERDRGPQGREETPSEPGGPDGEEPAGQEGEDEPGRAENPPGGENRPGDPRAEDGSASGARADDADRWGELPVRYREVFRNQGADDLPVQYREWIDAYHRRLSRARR